MEGLVNEILDLIPNLFLLPENDRIEAINKIKTELHKVSPFKHEPVDCVLWVANESVYANDYNPNQVAPPEMRLLTLSIRQDGYTQPIVTYLDEDGKLGTVDGFHRSKVGKEDTVVQKRTHGYLPVTIVNQERAERHDRIASTIRHNEARGTHNIQLTKDIVAELVQSGMSDDWIMKHIGMDADTLLRLKQITGIAALFKDAEFSKSWTTKSNLITEEL
jgi:ParB-like chromosome segregation protein Spo0J